MPPLSYAHHASLSNVEPNAPEGIRTLTHFRRPLLYPSELPARNRGEDLRLGVRGLRHTPFHWMLAVTRGAAREPTRREERTADSGLRTEEGSELVPTKDSTG